MLLESEQKHINNLITDYVLELLPSAQHESATRHIATCESCRQAVMRERQIGKAVRHTLTQATAVERRSLISTRPTVVRFDGIRSTLNQGKRRIVVACCLLILALTSVGLQLRLQQNSWLATAPAILSPTVIISKTPTATLLATSEGSEISGFTSPTPNSMKTKLLPKAILAPAAVYPAQLSSLSLQ